MTDEPNVTELLHRAAHGDVDAADRLFATVYADLRRMARARLRLGGRSDAFVDLGDSLISL